VANSAFKRAVRNTVMFSLASVPLAVVLSLILAIVLESKIPFKSQFRTFFLSPMMVPVASIVLIWQVLFHYNGAVNEVLAALGGSVGALLGMRVFRHKTLHRAFKFGVPLILILQTVIPFGLWLYFAVIR